mmetsp:Transcript_64142/g.134863  ORF Transcript_64142/g.134863 Transcript_64142/m.134863 type:complete len:562 (-) Transcript_64142:13-1698(-)
MSPSIPLQAATQRLLRPRVQPLGSFCWHAPGHLCPRKLHRILSTTSLQLILLTLALLLQSSCSTKAEVPLVWGPEGPLGLAVAEILVGTPGQKVKVQIDSGSSILWVPPAPNGSSSPAASGFLNTSSSTYKVVKSGVELPPYADGMAVHGDTATDVVNVGGLMLQSAPFMVGVAQRGSDQAPRTAGIMGLSALCEDCKSDGVVPGLFDNFTTQDSSSWSFRVELFEKSKRLVIDDTGDGLKDLQLLRAPWGSETSLWYASMRAIGVSGRKTGFFSRPSTVATEIDFNAYSWNGAATLFDSGAAAIRVSSEVFNWVLEGLPDDCKRTSTTGTASIECPCSPEEMSSDDIPDMFPTFTFSFEASDNTRFWGMDFGSDYLTCMPPAAYVVQVKDICKVAFVDGGRFHQAFGTEAIVLGVPFFRARAVGKSLKSSEVALGRDGSDGDDGGLACVCRDPKSWWSSGDRISFRRILVALALVGALYFYVFFNFSTSSLADKVRGWFDGASGGHRLGVELALVERDMARALPGRSPARNSNRVDLTAAERSNDPSSFVAMMSDADDHA